MTLTEKQQAAIEIFNSRNNIRSLDLTLSELETLRDRISYIIEELSNEQELKNVEAAIQALRLVNVEIPDELENKKGIKWLKAKLGYSTQKSTSC